LSVLLISKNKEQQL